MKIACLQHVPFEGPGAIGTWAASRGFGLSIIRLFANDPLPAPGRFDLLVILGGPMSVNQTDTFDWFRRERRFIRRALENQDRLLGICLGAQLIASALDCEVRPLAEREIGWHPVELTETAAGWSPLQHFPSTFPAFHWHGETFDLPPGSRHLARSAACPNQAFAVGDRVLALQFHLESTRESVEALIENCPGDLSPGPHVQRPEAMKADHSSFHQSNQLLFNLLDAFTSHRHNSPCS